MAVCLVVIMKVGKDIAVLCSHFLTFRYQK